jgi:hypothetical protein
VTLRDFRPPYHGHPARACRTQTTIHPRTQTKGKPRGVNPGLDFAACGFATRLFAQALRRSNRLICPFFTPGATFWITDFCATTGFLWRTGAFPFPRPFDFFTTAPAGRACRAGRTVCVFSGAESRSIVFSPLVAAAAVPNPIAVTVANIQIAFFTFISLAKKPFDLTLPAGDFVYAPLIVKTDFPAPPTRLITP